VSIVKAVTEPASLPLAPGGPACFTCVMTNAPGGRVRRVRGDEIQAWCACPFGAGDADLEDHIEGEAAWIEAWHDGPENLFVHDTGDVLLGKYDLPITSPRRLCLWAPSVVNGPHAKAVMLALCEHIRAEGERRGVADIEVILEGWHDHLDLARDALCAAGLPRREEKVVVRRDMAEALPAASCPGVEFRPAAGLSQDLLGRLIRDVGGSMDDPVSRGPSLEDHPLGLTMWRDGIPIGLAWPSCAPDDEVFTLHHLGLIPEARGQGLGAHLLRHSLAVARESGARIYVGSTAVANEPMRKTFARIGCEVLGHRFVHGLSLGLREATCRNATGS
jgi:GNAT superfamily N-acetyltransferase